MNFISFFFMLFFPVYISAATIHAVIAGDTSDPHTKKEVDRNTENLNNLLAEIEHAGLEVNKEILVGNLTEKSLLGTLKSLTVVKSVDTIIFYYSGHGCRFEVDGSPWPLMALSAGQPEKAQLVPVDKVTSILQEKEPRLFFVIVDTCNQVFEHCTKDKINTVPFPSSHIIPASQKGEIFAIGIESHKDKMYRELFSNYKGHVIAAAAKAGLQSFGTSSKGGYFTFTFLESLRTYISAADPSWSGIMQATVERPIYMRNPPYNNEQEQYQQPQYKLNLEYQGETAIIDTTLKESQFQKWPSIPNMVSFGQITLFDFLFDENKENIITVKPGEEVNASTFYSYSCPGCKEGSLNQIIIGIIDLDAKEAEACIYHGGIYGGGQKSFTLTAPALKPKELPKSYYVGFRYAQDYTCDKALKWWQGMDGIPFNRSAVGIINVE